MNLFLQLNTPLFINLIKLSIYIVFPFEELFEHKAEPSQSVLRFLRQGRWKLPKDTNVESWCGNKIVGLFVDDI